MKKPFEKFCWVITAVFAVLGALRLAWLAFAPSNAPQYAAEAAGICALVLVPYVFARAVQEFSSAQLKDS